MQRNMYTREQVNQMIAEKVQEVVQSLLNVTGNFCTEAPVEKTIKTLYPTHREIELREVKGMELVGKGSIYYIRATNKWGLAYYLKDKGTDKKRNVKTFATEDEARRFLERLIKEDGEVKAQVTDEKYYDKSYIIMNYGEEWLEDKRKNKLKDTTISTYKVALKKICEYMGEEYVQGLDKDRIIRFWRELNKNESKKSQEKIDKIRIVLRGLIKKATNEGVLEFDVLKALEEISYKQVKNNVDTVMSKEIPAISDENVLRLLQKCKSLKEKTILLVLLFTGMRVGELGALKWSRVYLDEQMIFIQETAATVGLTEPKTQSSKRKIYIGSLLKEVLEEWEKYIETDEKELKLRKKNSTEDFVFVNARGRILKSISVEKFLKTISQKSDIYEIDGEGNKKIITPHMARHTMATRVYRLTTNKLLVQRILGHSKNGVTERYIMVADEDMKNAAKLLDDEYKGNYQLKETLLLL